MHLKNRISKTSSLKYFNSWILGNTCLRVTSLRNVSHALDEECEYAGGYLNGCFHFLVIQIRLEHDLHTTLSVRPLTEYHWRRRNHSGELNTDCGVQCCIVMNSESGSYNGSPAELFRFNNFSPGYLAHATIPSILRQLNFRRLIYPCSILLYDQRVSSIICHYLSSY